MLNDDYKDILHGLLKNKAKFLVVGAYAMGVHGYVRATGDFDIWVEASQINSRKVYKTLFDFGAPVKEIEQHSFAHEGVVFQIGVPPRRIDVLTGIDGVTFGKAYRARKIVAVEGIKIPFLSMNDLIKNKQSTGRDKDRMDVKYLKGKN